MLERLSRGEQARFDALDEMIARAQGDPEAAFRSIAEVRAEIVRLRGYLNRPRPERAYVVPFTSRVTVAAGGITPTAATPFNFPKAGRVVGIRALVLEDLADVTHVTLSMVDSNNYPLVSNGTSGDFISFAALSGAPFQAGAGFFPFLFKRVGTNDQWTFQCSSKDPLPAIGSTTFTPEVSILVELDEV